MDLDHVSVSTIEAFTTCPRRAFLAKTVKAPDKVESPATALGRAVHKCLEMYHSPDPELHSKYTDAGSLVELFKAVIKGYDLLELRRFSDAFTLLEDYESGYPCNTPTIATEQQFEFPIGAFKVLGYIDRIDYLGDGVYRVVDYKTSFVKKEDAEIENDLQGIVYDCALRYMWEHEVPFLKGLDRPKRVIFDLHYLRSMPSMVEFSDKQRKDTLDFVEYMAAKIAFMDEEPDPQLNPYCSYCDYRGGCPLYSSDFSRFLGEELTGDIEDLVARYFELTSIKKLADTQAHKIQGRIITDLDRRGENAFHTEKIDARVASNPRTSYDVAQLKQLLGDRWIEFAVVDPSLVTKNGTSADKVLLEKCATKGYTRPFIRGSVNKRR